MAHLRRAARAHTKHRGHASHHAAPRALSENAKTAFDYFKGKGLTDEQAAGVVGNLDHEAPGLNPEQQQIGGGPGHGIAQWGANNPKMDRWAHKPGDNVADFAASHNESPTALQTQLDFTWYELNHGYGLSALQSQKTVEGATQSFEKHFEAAGKPEMSDRIARAKAAFAAFGGGGSRKITEGEPSVLVGHAQQPAAHVDSPDSGGGKVQEGHPTVLVGPNKLPFARVGDPTKIMPGTVVDGDSTVLLGGQPGSSGSK
jgi:uncharacterized Zn-binding protein involved in type VI secretion